MAQTQIACPRCKQMIPANVEQLFDVTADPQAKQRMLSGQSNHARCPYCGYQGRLATPVVYHDNEKELLLTFFPPELGLPVNEQERMIGPLIKQVMDRLPPEKRKGYLLKPQANLTYESMVETILGKDGVTPEMLKAQQDRVQFVERLMQVTSKDVRSELIKQNSKIIDEQFFALFSRIAQSAMNSGQEQAARILIDIQTQLLEETEYGRQLKESVGELEAAQHELQEAGQSLTREKLLDLVLASNKDSRIRAYVSLARNGMDYVFLQTLSERIDQASGEEKTRMEGIREKLLGFISDMDKQMEARYKQAQQFIESLLAQADIEQATQANIENFTQDAVEIAQQMLRQATEKNEYERMGKLQKMIQVLQAASAPPEIAIIEQLIQLPDAATVEQALTQNPDIVTQQLLDTLTGLSTQMESQADNPEAKAMGEKLNEIYKIALKLSMKKNMG
ncbi:MAG TPA: CpXC domain-containing protein [Anaerolineales bacterium]|nr:CpXC domain-containing protein [Anaerolineales bacterium]HNB37497.1 CpXC domain-containing protein [Anaerolineales bacterium]HNC09683.1 CpXC domain-containing protein [Anaerolineales bacterium]